MRAPAYLSLLAFALPSIAVATVPDARFTEAQVLNTGTSQATGLARPPDGSNRLFIGLKRGDIKVFEDGVLSPNLFASIGTIYTGSECGLIGMAFDPDYATNRYLYVFVTVSNSEQQIIRLTDNGGMGINPTPIITGQATVGANHDGGGIGFGPDGMLYWSIGDNGSGRGVDADLTLTAAKVLRATPTGEIPADNPFVDGVGGNEDLIWARGFRNPFTLTFEPGRGRLWVNVVGSSYEQVFIVNRGDHAGYNDFENNQPMGYITPAIKYRTNGTDNRNLTATGAVRSNGVSTFTTQNTHGFRRGERITITGVDDNSFNGTVFVASVPSPTTFTVAQAGADATSGTGSARSPDLGGCITGGAFYDGTDFAPELRGNFFFGDYNSDQVMRTILDANGDVESVDTFATNLNSPIDMEVGADGTLYMLGHESVLKRVSFDHTTQDVILSNTHARLTEGGRYGFAVRLAIEPAADVTVTVRNSGTDADVAIEDGAQLTFTQANWDRPQPVMLFAGMDVDSDDDATTISVESAGLATQTVDITVRDLNGLGIVLSSASVEVTEGSQTTFEVSLSDAPMADLTIDVTTASTDVMITGGASLTFTAANYNVPQTVTVAAVEDGELGDATADILLANALVATRTMQVIVHDNDSSAPAFTSIPLMAAVVGASYTYDAEASGLPAPTFVLDTAPSGVIFDRNAGTISFLPQTAGDYAFVLRATNGVAPDATQSWTVTAGADAAPAVMIVKPDVNAKLSGATNQWYGTATDDMGLTRAEFLIDGTVADTQTGGGASGRYDFKGTAMSFDTTTLTNGAHTLRLVVYDTAGQSAFAEVAVTVNNDTTTPPPPPPPPIGSGTTSGGCEGCTSTSGGEASAAWMLIALLALVLRRR